jgi:hypothetical protein
MSPPVVLPPNPCYCRLMFCCLMCCRLLCCYLLRRFLLRCLRYCCCAPAAAAAATVLLPPTMLLPDVPMSIGLLLPAMLLLHAVLLLAVLLPLARLPRAVLSSCSASRMFGTEFRMRSGRNTTGTRSRIEMYENITTRSKTVNELYSLQGYRSRIESVLLDCSTWYPGSFGIRCRAGHCCCFYLCPLCCLHDCCHHLNV